MSNEQTAEASWAAMGYAIAPCCFYWVQGNSNFMGHVEIERSQQKVACGTTNLPVNVTVDYYFNVSDLSLYTDANNPVNYEGDPFSGGTTGMHKFASANFGSGNGVNLESGLYGPTAASTLPGRPTLDSNEMGQVGYVLASSSTPYAIIKWNFKYS
jgi:hypothetical protein